MTRLLDWTAELLKCHFCALKFLTEIGRAAHESVCEKNPANKK